MIFQALLIEEEASVIQLELKSVGNKQKEDKFTSNIDQHLSVSIHWMRLQTDLFIKQNISSNTMTKKQVKLCLFRVHNQCLSNTMHVIWPIQQRQQSKNTQISYNIQQINRMLPSGVRITARLSAPMHKPPLLLIVAYCMLLVCTFQIEYVSNYNQSRVQQITIGDPIALPIILNPIEHRIKEGNAAKVLGAIDDGSSSTYEGYRIKRYELKDTNYQPEAHDLTEFENAILYSTEPPPSLFDIGRTLTIESYQLLQHKSLKITLTNPTDHFKFCLSEIYADNQSITRIEHRRLPFCINPNNKYPFYFNLYITEARPMAFRSTIYFVVEIYHGNELVDEKIWPKQIIAKVAQNHLRIGPVEARNCGNGKNFTTVVIPNPHNHNIKVSFDSEFENEKSQKQVMIPSQRNFKMQVLSKQTSIALHARIFQSSLGNEIRYPRLHLPIYCVKMLELDHFNIGILNADRSTVEIIIPVTSYTSGNIEIKAVDVRSTGQNVEIGVLEEVEDVIPGGKQHVGLCRLLVHVPKEPIEKTTIQVKVLYFLESNPKQIFETNNTYTFIELRNPLSMSGRRFIDLTKPSPPQSEDPILSSTFPIRNNLNLPLLLFRVIYNQQLFKITYLKDRREYIYPNQQREQFSLQYIGSKKLAISPMKYIIILEFNGNLLIPVEIVVFDHSLQCVYQSVQQKCQNLGLVDFGYFRNSGVKFRQIVIRNWNPVQKQVMLKFIDKQQSFVQKFGMNFTINIFGPYPEYEFMKKYVDNVLHIYLKGNHFVIINIGITPLSNCTSGETQFQISTVNQKITKKMKFKVENGTIALIPQILRINSAYEQSMEYLNLVSTFSQPYRIKNTFVNSTHINFFYNNHSQIYENQWIGLALVYRPFPVYSAAALAALPKSEVCCSNDYFIGTFVPSLYKSLNESRQFVYVSVRVVTTTELEANSTIIINNTPPKLLADENIVISLINPNNHDQRSKQNFKQTSHFSRGQSASNTRSQFSSSTSKRKRAGSTLMDNSQHSFNFHNVFKETLKYRTVLIPSALVQDPKGYVTNARKIRKMYDDAHLCVDNAIAVKHNFSPQMVKSMFSLDMIPQQLTIEPLDNQEYYITGSPNRRSSPSSSSSLQTSNNNMVITAYVRKAVADGARLCYKLNTTKYIKELIETHIVNDLAENYSTETLHQLVQKQVEHVNTFTHYLENDQFYYNLDFSFEKYCNRQGQQFGYFRFCKQIGITVSVEKGKHKHDHTDNDGVDSTIIENDHNDQQQEREKLDGQHKLGHNDGESVLTPGESGYIKIKSMSRNSKDAEYKFYLLMMNNVTKYELHHVQVSITEPKLKIAKIYSPTRLPSANACDENKQNKQTDHEKWPKANNEILRKHFSKRQLTKMANPSAHKQQDQQQQPAESQSQLNKFMSSALPVFVTHKFISAYMAVRTEQSPQSQQSSVNGVQGKFVKQVFTVANTGVIDVHISHVGFQNKESICQYEGIIMEINTRGMETQINKSRTACQPFTIQKGQQINITLYVPLSLMLQPAYVPSSSPLTGNSNLLAAYDIYLYSWQDYYFKLQMLLITNQPDTMGASKPAHSSFMTKSVNYFVLTLISFIYVVLVIFKLKKEIDEKEKLRKKHVKTRIMASGMYYQLGSRLEKKVRKLQPIPEDQIAAVKEIQQSRIKQFFNSSDQSQISKRHHTEQEQPSNIQILNALKHTDKNNMNISNISVSASEGQSSIDFIDLNALNLNKSHIGKDNEVEGETEEKEKKKKYKTKPKEEDQQKVKFEVEQPDEPDEPEEGEEPQQEESGQGQSGQGVEQQPQDKQDEDSEGNLSDADSNFTEGDVIDYKNVKNDFGWGDPNQQRKKKKQEDGNSYYNVFFSQNPLKKSESSQPFHWMNNDYQRGHHHR